MMRRMMTVNQVAEAFDIKPIRIHKALKRSGMRLRLQKVKGQYQLEPEDIEQLARIMKRPTPVLLTDSPGLPLEWWGVPEHRDAFTIERFRREARLLALIRIARTEGRISA